MCDLNETARTSFDILEFVSANYTIRSELEKVTLPVWFSFGVPGAILSLLVWTRPALRQQSSGIYLAALAIADIFFFLVHIPWYLDSAWDVPVLRHPVFCETFAMVNFFLQYMSPVLTLGFTVERYIAVCHPFIRDQLCTTSRAYKVTGAITVLCFLLSTPHAYIFHYQEPGVCRGRPEINDVSSWQHQFAYYWFLITEVIIFGLVPFGVLLFNSLVIREMKRLSKEPHSAMFYSKSIKPSKATTNDVPSHSSRAATTWMLLCVSFYQIFATLPLSLCQILLFFIPTGSNCLQIDEILEDPLWRNQIAFLNIRAVIESLAFSHYAAKFYICLACGRLFRRELVDMFSIKKKEEDPRRFKRLLKRPSVM